MYKTDSLLVEKCRFLRRKGFTLGEIVKAVRLPKTTVYDHIYNIALSSGAQERLKRARERIAKDNTKRINEFNIKVRKGKCIPGRFVPKPKEWTKELIFLVAHFIFDGEATNHSCIYHNRNKALVKRIRVSMRKIFHLWPRESFNKGTGVYRISYNYVELADYIKRKTQELNRYIRVASLPEKKIFLKVFFDDEGGVNIHRNIRRVRGYQYNLEILRLIQKLLKNFDIKSRIDDKYKEIIISRKPNLIKFRNKINFSKGIYINPNRKNSTWKKKLEKREILDRIISSYKN